MEQEWNMWTVELWKVKRYSATATINNNDNDKKGRKNALNGSFCGCWQSRTHSSIAEFVFFFYLCKISALNVLYVNMILGPNFFGSFLTHYLQFISFQCCASLLRQLSGLSSIFQEKRMKNIQKCMAHKNVVLYLVEMLYLIAENGVTPTTPE